MSDRYQVTIVKYGTLATKKSSVYLNYALYHEEDEPQQMDYFFWILKNAERTIVVDTGFSHHGGDVRGRTTLVDVGELFAALGVYAKDAPDVIVTHAHYDHIGNLNLFPNSRVFLAEAELAFWNSRHATREMFHHSIEDAEVAHLNDVKDEGRLVTFNHELEVAPGVILRVIGGHTPGQVVVTVNTSEGRVLLASDAIHFYEEYDRDRLFSSVADLVAMYEGFDRIRHMQDTNEITHVVAGHDPSTLSRFHSITGALAPYAATIGVREDLSG